MRSRIRRPSASISWRVDSATSRRFESDIPASGIYSPVDGGSAVPRANPTLPEVYRIVSYGNDGLTGKSGNSIRVSIAIGESATRCIHSVSVSPMSRMANASGTRARCRSRTAVR
jgi:hypothetical protein